jgi:DNA-binding CsgD family transcriptional regulator
MLDVADGRRQLGLLTQRQREVLDLVLAHKSSKEIAASLGISPNTVDQHIFTARDRLGVTTRRQLARVYADLVKGCGQTTSEFSWLDSQHSDVQVDPKVSGDGPVYTLADAGIIDMPMPWNGPPSLRGLGALDRKFGVAGRILAIFAAVALLALALLAVVTIMMNVSRIV